MRLVIRRELRRGVLILPSLFTLSNLFCGFYALIEAAKGRFGGPDMEGSPAAHLSRAALFIALAMVLDGLDGKIARATRATSDLGVQLDSLADVVSFGVAPGVLVYTWALVDLGRLGWAVAFVFTSCGALRLARFNVLAAAHHDNRHFVGLPIPAAAGSIAAVVVLSPAPLTDRPAEVVVAVATVLLSLLMVSTIRYHSFKQVDLKRRHPIRNLLPVVFVLAMIAWLPEPSLAGFALLYTLSGPVERLVALLRRRKPTHMTPETEAEPGRPS